MTTSIIPFSFENHEIRVVEIDNEPWFVAKDVAEALEYTTWHHNLISHVPEEWKGSNPITTLGGMQEMLMLSEQGVYFFINRSDKPKALPLQKWIAGEVLPAIRKTGSYQHLASQPDNYSLVPFDAKHPRDKLFLIKWDTYKWLNNYASGQRELAISREEQLVEIQQKYINLLEEHVALFGGKRLKT